MNNKKLSKAFRIAGMAGTVALMLTMPAFAAGDGVTDILTNLVNLLFDIMRLLGVITLIFGIVQLGMSFASHDPSQRITAAICIAGGLLLVFVKTVLTAIGVTV